MRHIENSDRKYVFVCGLHRSGTTVLAKNIGKFTNCTQFENTGASMDEGQFLQDVYPRDLTYGGVGRFAFDLRAHLTEASRFLTPENIAILRQSWHLWWDQTKLICVEKTPANIVMTRFLQAAFPNAYFIVLRRHPVPLSLATQNWCMTSMHSLFEHWLQCHDIFEKDKKYLKHVYELNYEEYIECPDKYHDEIATFIGTRVEKANVELVSTAHNKKYFDTWNALLLRSPFRSYYRCIARKYESRFAVYGYSLTKGQGSVERVFNVDQALPSGIGKIYCLLADASAFLMRFPRNSKRRIMHQAQYSIDPRPYMPKLQATKNEEAGI
jgi:Sulfotransferase family